MSIDEARAALVMVHGINNPTARQIALFVLFGIVDKSETMA